MAKRSFAEASSSDAPTSPETADSPDSVDTAPADHPHPKLAHLSPSTHRHGSTKSTSTISHNPMSCTLPPHTEPLSFHNPTEYESHYVAAHVNRCAECGKNMPSEHFLDLHIREWHDPFLAGRRAAGERTVSFLFTTSFCPLRT